MVGTHFQNTDVATATYALSQTTSSISNIHKITFTNGEIEFIQSNTSTEPRSDAIQATYLKKINIYTFKDNVKTLIRSIVFNYSYFKNANNNDARLKLDKISFVNQNATENKDYTFNYFTNSFAWLDNVADYNKQDYFGYYNGKPNQSTITLAAHTVSTPTGSKSIPIVNGGADRGSVDTFSKNAVLSSIIYPSGGNVDFDYENNQYFDTGTNTTKLAGGLRIKSIKNSMAPNSKPIMKRYVYGSDYGVGIGKLPTTWFPESNNLVVNQNLYYTDLAAGASDYALQAIISPHGPVDLGSQDASPVYYTHVQEYFEEDTAAIKNGKNEYVFSFRTDQIVSVPHYHIRDCKPWKRGQMVSMKTFDQNNILLKTLTNNYADFKDSSKVNAAGYINTSNLITGNPLYCPSGMLIGANYTHELSYYTYPYYTSQSKLTSTTTIIDTVSATKTIEYDKNLMVLKTAEDDSSPNSFKVTKNTYPTHASFSSDAVAAAMKNRNMIDTPIITEIIDSINGQNTTLFKQQSIYKQFATANARGLTNTILPFEIWVAPTGNLLEKRVEFVKYNTNSKPLEYKVDGISTALVWGYNDSEVIALASNISTDTLTNALASKGIIAANFSVTNLNATQFSQLKSLQSSRKNSLIKWFTHIPHLGLSESYEPNAVLTSYYYDTFQRLSHIKNNEGNIIAWHKYQQSPLLSYMASGKVRTATTDLATAQLPANAEIVTQFFDGLNYPTQKIAIAASPLSLNIILSQNTFDRWGRGFKNLNPTPTNTSSNLPINNAEALAKTFYNDLAVADLTLFEQSPLNRPTQQFGVGNAWRTNNKKTQIFFGSAGTDVRYYSVNAANSVTLNGFYPAKSLFKKRVIDEQGKATIEITDKRGRLIQTQNQDDTGYITTYYCYDGLGRPRAIIQPLGYELNASINAATTEHDKYVFAYHYDGRGRTTAKHIPAAGWSAFVYDKLDRPVLSQDAHQASIGQWSFKTYDALNRVAFDGTIANNLSQATAQAAYDAHPTPNEEWNGAGGYSGSSMPSSVNQSMSVANFYFADSYDFVANLGNTLAFDASHTYLPKYDNAKALPTGGVSYNLPMQANSTAAWCITITSAGPSKANRSSKKQARPTK